MTAQIIYGTDFKRANPKSDRAFWIGGREIPVEAIEGLVGDNFKFPDPLEQMAVEIVNQIFPDQDTAPAEYVVPSGDAG